MCGTHNLNIAGSMPVTYRLACDLRQGTLLCLLPSTQEYEWYLAGADGDMNALAAAWQHDYGPQTPQSGDHIEITRMFLLSVICYLFLKNIMASVLLNG